jgi:hypothetical protein
VNSSFDESLARFHRFLEGNGYPREIVWLTAYDVIVTSKPFINIRVPSHDHDNERHARELFELGTTERRGVLFDTVCDGGNITYCYAWVPLDSAEAERSLMSRGLKLSVKTGPGRIRAEVVKNWLQWIILKIWYRKYRGLRDELFHIER